MLFVTRRPAMAREAHTATRFAIQLSSITALGYTSVTICATQNNLHAFLGFIGPIAAISIAYCGYLFLRQQTISSIGAICGILLGSSLGVGITVLLGGVSLPIAFQAVGIAGGISSVIGMRFGWKATIPSAILGGLCAAAGASMLPTMLEKGTAFAWLVNILGSAAATYWLGIGIAKVCTLENPVALRGLLKRLSTHKQPEENLEQTTPTQETKNPTNPELTSKELEMLKLLNRGLSDRKMGIILGLSESGIRNRLGTTRKKLNAKNRTELIAKAVQYGIITEPRSLKRV
jgi:DNA-binding CsgD family transcriptional regulator